MSVQLGFSLSNEEGKGEEGRVEGNMPGTVLPNKVTLDILAIMDSLGSKH